MQCIDIYCNPKSSGNKLLHKKVGCNKYAIYFSLGEDITTICQPKWRTPSSGCQEAWDDFGCQSRVNFLRYGNIPIVATLDAEIMLVVYHGEFGGASLVLHFPCRMSRRSFPGRTFCFPPKKPKMSAGRWYDIIDPEEAGPPGAPGFSKKKRYFFSADTLTCALTRVQVRRPQSARVKVRSLLPASRKMFFFFENPKGPRWPRFPGIDSNPS